MSSVVVEGGAERETKESRQRRRGMKRTISALLPRLDGRYFPGGRPATWCLSPFSTVAKATVTLDLVYCANTHIERYTKLYFCIRGGTRNVSRKCTLENSPKNKNWLRSFSCNKCHAAFSAIVEPGQHADGAVKIVNKFKSSQKNEEGDTEACFHVGKQRSLKCFFQNK